MIPCPKGCQPKPKVLETRAARRRYECTLCGERYTTAEEIVPDYTYVNGVPPALRTLTHPTQQPGYGAGIRAKRAKEKLPPRREIIPKLNSDLPKGPKPRDIARNMIEDRETERALAALDGY